MEDLVSALASQFVAQSAWELLAVVLAIGYVWLAARQSIWCWPCALVSTAIYTWLFWEVALPFNSVLNAYYLLMAVYGWYQWKRTQEPQKPVVRWRTRTHAIAITGLFIVVALLAEFAQSYFNSERVWLDAFVTVFSVFTTVLVAHKVLENWLYWMVINLFAAYLYFTTGLLLTALLFVSYFFFAVYGYASWRDTLSDREAMVQGART